MRKIVKELPAGYTIQILRSIKEIEEIRPFWEEKQAQPNGDIDLIINIINSKKEIVCPYIILILLNKKPEAMMVGIIEKKGSRLLYPIKSYLVLNFGF
jgi:hypothetical protein